MARTTHQAGVGRFFPEYLDEVIRHLIRTKSCAPTRDSDNLNAGPVIRRRTFVFDQPFGGPQRDPDLSEFKRSIIQCRRAAWHERPPVTKIKIDFGTVTSLANDKVHDYHPPSEWVDVAWIIVQHDLIEEGEWVSLVNESFALLNFLRERSINRHWIDCALGGGIASIHQNTYWVQGGRDSYDVHKVVEGLGPVDWGGDGRERNRQERYNRSQMKSSDKERRDEPHCFIGGIAASDCIGEINQ